MKRREFIGVAAASLAWPFWRSASASALPSPEGGAAATLARGIGGKVFVPGSATKAKYDPSNLFAINLNILLGKG